MLNAFRHQRNKQLPSVCQPTGTKRAQRLSASTEQTGLSGLQLCKKVAGAQRLSASTEQTDVGASFLGSKHRVLNAFRHQRNKQPSLQAVNRIVHCAQRLSASTEQTGTPGTPRNPSLLMCSTPFGINGTNRISFPRWTCPTETSAQRLSASTEQTV